MWKLTHQHDLERKPQMSRNSQTIKAFQMVLAWLCFLPAAAPAIEFDEIRDYGDVFRISGRAIAPDLIEVRWDIEPDYYLYNNKFLEFTAQTPGVVLGVPVVPEGEQKYDPLLGKEVIKFHDRLVVSIPLTLEQRGVDRLTLRVRSQGCLEDVLCYPPTFQELSVALPPAQPAAQAAGLDALLGIPGASPMAEFGGADAPLGAAEVFQFEAIGFDEETVLVRFTPRPGNYLYRDKFEFSIEQAAGFSVRAVELPEGTIKDDPEFGPVPVYFDTVEIPVRLNRPAGPEQALVLKAGYQGCKDGEICYPPQTARIELQMPGAEAAISEALEPARGMTPPVSEQDRLARLLTQNPPAAIFAFFLAGLLLAFTPCVFPMVPILSGLIAGQGERLTTGRAFTLSLVYVLAMSVTYTVAGVLAGMFGQNLQAVFQNPWIISAFVLVFVLLALSMFGFYELQLPSRWQTALAARSNRAQGGHFTGVAVMGFLSALIVGPCVAPPLAAALIVIGASGSAALGGSALFALSMGMGVPLILFGVSAGKLIPRAGAWMDTIKAFFGVGLLALGIWMLERILPGGVIMLLWGTLAIACGVFLGALERAPGPQPGWKRLGKTLGLILLVLGVLEIIGAATGGDRWTEPLRHLRVGQALPEPEFQRIKSLQDLDEAVAQASAAGHPAMLDFYADWCVECIRMERNTFPEPEVAGLLAQMQLLQADVTPNDSIDQALMQRFGIIGPPAILFFDRQGRELRDYRLVGYFTPEEFSTHLERVLAVR
jgi:thiol:disulfide interchange protein DsbD